MTYRNIWWAIANAAGQRGAQSSDFLRGDRFGVNARATASGSGKRCDMAEKKERTLSPTTLKLGLIRLVERAREKLAKLTASDERRAVKYRDRKIELLDQLKVAEAELDQLLGIYPELRRTITPETNKFIGIADDDDIPVGGTD